ncbi:erythromycin esterase family protein [Streptomyces sp. DH37]|uniref:erythromycin esterase family protein n=1 Tax=Streptomyces sp. DH37 TaxID=3040122 RepID=UPI0034DE3A1B
MTVPPARSGSVEELTRRALPGGSALFTREDGEDGGDAAPARRSEELGHRAIGVVHRPHAERRGNYVPTVLGRRYGAFLHLDRTRAPAPTGTSTARAGGGPAPPAGVRPARRGPRSPGAPPAPGGQTRVSSAAPNETSKRSHQMLTLVNASGSTSAGSA